MQDPVGQRSSVILASVEARHGRPAMTFRQAGDRFLLVELGPMEFDLTLSFWSLALNQVLSQLRYGGVIETIPAVRSVLLHYEAARLSPSQLIEVVEREYDGLPSIGGLVLPSRRIELPIAFNDRWTREIITRYSQYIRKDAPNIINNNNIEYAAIYNGLKDADEVADYIMSTEWWVSAIGFFPGLPFCFPLDPRYALILPKYNPTRPWTVEGAVGLAGPCLSIYSVPSPGGYQLLGRTIPVYDPKQRNPAFATNPILLRPGDRLRFRPRVTDEELDAMIQAVYGGTYQYVIDETATFDVGEYLRFLDSVREEADAFRRHQAEAAARVPIP